MFMSESIFFENIKIFQIPGRFGTARLFMWMIIIWSLPFFGRLYVGKSIDFKVSKSNVLDYCVLFLVVISIIGLIMTLIQYLNSTGVFIEFFTLFSLFGGYYIIKNWTSRNSLEVIKEFLFSLVIINTISSCLYILHQGLGQDIYLLANTGEDLSEWNEITRVFWYMPQLLSLSLAYALVFKEKKSFLFSFILIINLLAIFITYTRSAAINAVFMFLIYFVVTGIKKGRLGLVLRNIFLYGMLGVLGLIGLSKALPSSTQYFFDRFDELRRPSLANEPNNLELRFIMMSNVLTQTDSEKLIFGMGPVTDNQEESVPLMKRVTADIVWAGVSYRWGIIGLVLFALLYGLSGFVAFNLYMKSAGILSNLALMILLIIVSQFVESFVSWTFLSGHGFATGLWYFALLSVLMNLNMNRIMPMSKS